MWFDKRPLVAIAPMEGITDKAYRTLVRRITPEVILFTEFVNASGLLHGAKRVWTMAEFTDDERPIVVQLYDHDPEKIGLATREIAKRLHPDGIDLNMGCPVRKVVARGAGCAMMADISRSAESVRRMVTEAGSIPVSIKSRLGIADKREVVDFARACIEAGASQVSIHARLKDVRPRVPADWDALSYAARRLDTTVIGNGDVWSEEDALRMVALEGVDGVMIGRGGIGNPWLLKRIAQKLAGKAVDKHPSRETRARTAIEHLELNVKAKGERRGVLEMRKIVRHYIKGYNDSKRTWLKLIEVDSTADTIRVLEEFANKIPEEFQVS